MVLLECKYILIAISEQGRLGIWALDGDPNHTGLLKYALTEQNFEHTLVMLVASMAHPWSILDSLENWVSVLRQHIDRLKLLPEDRKDYEQSCKYYFLSVGINTPGKMFGQFYRGNNFSDFLFTFLQ